MQSMGMQAAGLHRTHGGELRAGPSLPWLALEAGTAIDEVLPGGPHDAVGDRSALDGRSAGDTGLVRAIEGNECDAYRSLFEVAAALHGRRAFTVEEDGGVSVFSSPLVRQPGVFNRVLGLGLASRPDPRQLRDVAGRFAARGLGLVVDLAPHGLSEPLRAELRNLGLRGGARSAMVVRQPRWLSATHIAHAWPPARDFAWLRVERAADAAQRKTVAAICAKVFALDGSVRAVLESLNAASGWQHWLVRERDEPAAAGLSFISGDRCWFGWAATLPEFRGCGLKGALDDTRVAHALAAGCSFISSDTPVGASAQPDPSLRSFRRRGFAVAYQRAAYAKPAASIGLPGPAAEVPAAQT